MSDLPLPQTPPEDENSWETLAEDLFGIDLTKKEAADAEPVSDDEFDALTGNAQVSETAEPRTDDAGQAEQESSVPESPEPIRLEFTESEELEFIGSEEGESPFSIASEGGVRPDEADSAENQFAEAETEETETAPSAKDDYWDVLDEWDWDAESKAQHAPESDRPSSRQRGPRRSRGEFGKGRQAGGDRGRGGSRKGGPRRGDSPRSQKSAPAEGRGPSRGSTTARPETDRPRERSHHPDEDSDDFDFGAGLIDERKSVPEDEPEPTQLEETGDEPIDETTELESDAPRKRRRRRRRRRRTRSESGEMEQTPSSDTESDDDEVSAEGLPDDEAGFPVDEESPDSQRESSHVPQPAQHNGGSPAGRSTPVPELDASDEDDLSDDDDLLDDDDESADEQAESGERAPEEGRRAPRATDKTGQAPYRSIPTWEEAISYLVKAVGRDERSRDTDGGRGYRKPDSAKSSKSTKPPGRRGRKKR